MNIIETASASKANFDRSMEQVRSALQNSVDSNNTEAVENVAATGWLKGSLSYPWVLVASLIPSLKELF